MRRGKHPSQGGMNPKQAAVIPTKHSHKEYVPVCLCPQLRDQSWDYISAPLKDGMYRSVGGVKLFEFVRQKRRKHLLSSCSWKPFTR